MAAKDYDAIARAKIRRPDQIDRKPRILVYGRNKKGKTTLCNTAPGVLILDPENGTDELKRSNPDVWPITNWLDLDEVYHYLKGSKDARKKYQWIAVDGTTRMSNMALRYVMRQEEERNLERRPGFVEQRDYGKAGELFKGMLLNLQSLPFGVIYTAQERFIEVGDNGENDEDSENVSAMFVPDLPKGARASLNSIVDVIGRLYVVNATKKVRKAGEIVEKDYKQRRLWLGDHPQYDTGYRSEFDLPEHLKDPTVERLINLMRTGDPRDK